MYPEKLIYETVNCRKNIIYFVKNVFAYINIWNSAFLIQTKNVKIS